MQWFLLHHEELLLAMICFAHPVVIRGRVIITVAAGRAIYYGADCST